MISSDLLLPQSQIYNFLKTLTIKFSPLAEYVNNNLLENNYSVNFSDPTTWKYYLNMIGSYHESDTQMYVASLDTKEQILFAPDVLEEHPRTRQAYLPGSVYYDRLCALHPSQVDLIKSILFPLTDIQTAISSEDFTLLNYGEGFLEEWELPVIISALEKFLYIYKERWYFDFLDDEPYFHITTWANMWFYLAMVIMSSRVENIKTPYVHSWHIWNKLKSKGIGDYSDILNRKKSMLLYQNIDYFKGNVGKQSNLVILAIGLLFDFGIGVYNRKVVLETETNSGLYRLTPLLEAVKIPLDYGTVTVDIPAETVEAAQNQIYQLGLTPSRSAETILEIEDRVGTTTLNDFATKLMEIRPIAKNTPYAQSLSNFYMETLIVSISKGYYTHKVRMIEPLTKTILYLTPSELLALFHYAAFKSIGIEATTIPTTFDLNSAFKTTIGTPRKSFRINNELYVVKAFVDVSSYLSDLNYETNLQNPKQFGEMAGRMWLKYMFHTLEDQGTSIDKKRVILNYMDTLCRERKRITFTLVDGYTDFGTWLGDEGIDIQNDILSQYVSQENEVSSWENLMIAIMTSLIPTDSIIKAFTDITLSQDEYDRLTKLFVDMCSYRVLFLKSSPEIPSSYIGPKLSNVYGPDAISTYDEVVSIIRTTVFDDISFNKEIELREGSVQNIKSETNSPYTFDDFKIFPNSTDHIVKYGASRKAVDTISGTSVIGAGSPMPYITNRAQLVDPSV